MEQSGANANTDICFKQDAHDLKLYLDVVSLETKSVDIIHYRICFPGDLTLNYCANAITLRIER